MKASIIIPFNGEPSRKEAASFVIRYYCEAYEYEVITCDSGEGLFSKAQAINNGAALATGDTLILADADTIITPEQLDKGINESWCIPFNRCLNLQPEDTELVIRQNPLEVPFWAYTPRKVREKWTYAGGVNIVSREALDLVGGMDPRYLGWGGEDESFCRAVSTMHKPAVIIPGDVYHLHHETDPTQRKFTKKGGGFHFYQQYRWCTSKPERMQKILEDSHKGYTPNPGLAKRVKDGNGN